MAAGYTSSTARGGLFNQVGGTSSLTDVTFLSDQHGDFSVAGDIIVAGEVDGRDVATDGVELDALVAAYGGGVATATTLNVTNINAYDTTASATIASATGVFTITSAVLTTADINGGTVDGAVVGGTTPAAGTFTTLTSTGNVVVTGTVDGRDVATDGTKLDTIDTNAADDQTAAEIRAAVEAATDSNVFTDADHTKLDTVDTNAADDQTDAEIRTAVEAATDSNVFTDADHTKLNNIEALADVTDVANVTAAGALMDSEVDVNIKTFVLPASTTISAFGASVIDDADAATARTTLDVDQAGEALALAIALG